MKKALFNELLGSAHDALEHAQGKRNLRTTVRPAPPHPLAAADVKRLRRRVNASQAVFAGSLNVSVELVQAWEAGRRTPSGAALKLLSLVARQPALVFEPSQATALTRRRRVVR